MIRAALAATPWAVPGSLAILAGAGLASARIARILKTSRLLAFGLIASLGAALLVTLSPSVDAGPGRRRFASWELTLDTFRDLGTINEATLNIALFVPLGFLVALHGGRSARKRLVAGVLLLPVLVELIQYAFPSLGRSGFQMNDVIANLVGVTVGLGLGYGTRRVVELTRRATTPSSARAA